MLKRTGVVIDCSLPITPRRFRGVGVARIDPLTRRRRAVFRWTMRLEAATAAFGYPDLSPRKILLTKNAEPFFIERIPISVRIARTQCGELLLRRKMTFLMHHPAVLKSSSPPLSISANSRSRLRKYPTAIRFSVGSTSHAEDRPYFFAFRMPITASCSLRSISISFVRSGRGRVTRYSYCPKSLTHALLSLSVFSCLL